MFLLPFYRRKVTARKMNKHAESLEDLPYKHYDYTLVRRIDVSCVNDGKLVTMHCIGLMYSISGSVAIDF